MTPDSRNLYRNHQIGCPHREEGRAFKKCRCPVWVDFSYAGKRLWKSLRTRNWRKAEDRLRELEVADPDAQNEQLVADEAHSEPAPERRSETVEAACRKFLADAEARDLSQATRGKYALILRRLGAFAQQRSLCFIDDFTVDVVRDFRASLNHHGTASRKRIEELRTFFRFCQDSGWIASNPAKTLRPPKETPAPIEPFTDEEIEAIQFAYRTYIQGANGVRKVQAQRLGALVELMIHTGLRIGDAVRLRRDQIAGGRVRIRTEKTGTPVCCPLPECLVRELLMVQGTSIQYFFWTGSSKLKSAVGDWQRALKKLFKLAGVVGGHAHRFRHTFAKRLLMAGIAVADVAVLMGHRSPDITLKHYSAWVKERQEQLEASIARVWKRSEESKRPDKETVKSLKQHKSVIQALYGNGSGWLN